MTTLPPMNRLEELPSPPTASTSCLPLDLEQQPVSSQNTRGAETTLERERERDREEEEEEEEVWYSAVELQVRLGLVLFYLSRCITLIKSKEGSHCCCCFFTLFSSISFLIFETLAQDILLRSTTLKQQGNVLFGKGDYETALVTYREGLVELPLRSRNQRKVDGGQQKEEEETIRSGVDQMLAGLDLEEGGSNEKMKEDEEKEELKELRSILFANVAACLLKLVGRLFSSCGFIMWCGRLMFFA